MRGQRVTDNGMAKKFTKPPTISEKEARVFEGGFSEHRLMKKAPGLAGASNYRAHAAMNFTWAGSFTMSS